MTSHDLIRAADLASRLVVLSKGKIQTSVSKAQFQSKDLVALYRGALSGGEVAK